MILGDGEDIYPIASQGLAERGALTYISEMCVTLYFEH